MNIKEEIGTTSKKSSSSSEMIQDLEKNEFLEKENVKCGRFYQKLH